MEVLTNINIYIILDLIYPSIPVTITVDKMKLNFVTFLYFLILFFKVKIPTVQSKRHCFCDDLKIVDLPSLSHQENRSESLPMVSEIEILCPSA